VSIVPARRRDRGNQALRRATAVGAKENLVIVAGPSGAGKSTLMEMLGKGELSPTIESALPGGARNWPQFGHRRSQTPDRDTEIVLHYTIVYPRLMGFSFDQDPVLSPLQIARKATILTLRADSHVVRQRYAARRIERTKAHGPLRMAIRRLRRQLRRSSAKPDLAGLYSDPEWLRGVYDEWDEFLLAQSKLRELVLIDVAPVHGPSLRPDFRLIRPNP